MSIDFTRMIYLIENEIIKTKIENLLVDKNNMEIAVDSLYKGRFSEDLKPIEVYEFNDKFVVANGHHRLLQKIINKENTIFIKILNLDFPINEKQLIDLDFYDGNFYGLDHKLENGWLIKRIS